jgi:hypothetical protein
VIKGVIAVVEEVMRKACQGRAVMGF